MTKLWKLACVILAVISLVDSHPLLFNSTEDTTASETYFPSDVTPTSTNHDLALPLTSTVVEHEASTPTDSPSSEAPYQSPTSIDYTPETTTEAVTKHWSIVTSLTNSPNISVTDDISETQTPTETSSELSEKSYIPLGSVQIFGFHVNSSNESNKLDSTDVSNTVMSIPDELRNDSFPLDFLKSAEVADLGGEDQVTLLHEDQGNPYSHWDSDSEEQEIELHLKEESEQDLNTEIVDTEPSSVLPPSVSRSYLILLAGNSTIVKLRQEDFAKYLKLNLAARLSLEYDDVRVNRVVLAPPRLVVNVSVVTPEASAESDVPERLDEKSSDNDAPLHMLAETNATLLELSGEEYHVVRLLPLRSEDGGDIDSDITPSPNPRDAHGDIELVIYTVLGGICVVIIFATLLRIAVQRYNNITNVSWFMPKSLYPTWNLPRHERMSGEEIPVSARHDNYISPPTVIYSGSFAARAATTNPGWMEDALLEDNGMSAFKRPFDMDISRTYQSPSKLHIFSCRPGSVVMPMPYHTPSKSHHHTEEQSQEGEVRCLGHDNPNYQT